ncbi:hypothetical protein LIA77_10961 [Sarocladium implicatum]|nr:hypothetical protein LIA77_10961 [Sarocladium implicatum]
MIHMLYMGRHAEARGHGGLLLATAHGVSLESFLENGHVSLEEGNVTGLIQANMPPRKHVTRHPPTGVTVVVNNTGSSREGRRNQ